MNRTRCRILALCRTSRDIPKLRPALTESLTEVDQASPCRNKRHVLGNEAMSIHALSC